MNAQKIMAVHIKTGETLYFDSHSLAGAEMVKRGLAKTTPRGAEQSIWRALKGLRKTAYGYQWSTRM